MLDVKIYQINMERDMENVGFMGLSRMERLFGSINIDSSIYDKVFEGSVECGGLEDVYALFNMNHPAGYRGRSLSVSDVVQVLPGCAVEAGFYFCDSMGFKQIEFEPEKCHAEEINTIKVVLVEPNQEARIADINSSLEGLQQAVGGYIECYYPFDEEVCIVCNEEGKLNGMPLNRSIRDNDGTGRIVEIMAGPFFICDCSGENLGSLNEEQLKRYCDKFKSPELFFYRNGEIESTYYVPTKVTLNNQIDMAENDLSSGSFDKNGKDSDLGR